MLNSYEIFSYDSICNFYDAAIKQYQDFLHDKIKRQKIVTALKEANGSKKELRVTMASIVLESFDISGTKCIAYLNRIFNAESTHRRKIIWAKFMQQCDTLPHFDLFLSKTDQYIHALSGDINRLAYDIAHDTTTYDEEMLGVAYKAEFSNKSIFISLSNVQHKYTEGLGWKFHVSLNKEKENISMAWNIVQNILIKNEAPNFKILAPNSTPEYEQIGKQITLYHFKNSQHDWHSILQQIESALTEHDIKSSDFNVVDKQIEGSQYISYRNDKGPDGQYLPAERAKTQYFPIAK